MTTLKEFKNIIKQASKPSATSGEKDECLNADANSDKKTRSRMTEGASG